MYAHELESVLLKVNKMLEQRALETELRVLQSQQQGIELAAQLDDYYQKMAQVFLQTSPVGSAVRDVQHLLSRFAGEREQQTEKLQILQTKIRRELQEQQQLTQQIDSMEAQRDQQVEASSELKQALAQFARAQEAATLCQEQHETFHAEYVAKVAEYEQDFRFDYLLKRKFAQPEYRAGGILRNLDSWIARQVDFSRNFGNYQLLHSLHTESAARLEEAQAELQVTGIKKDAGLQKIENRLGLPALYASLADLRSRIEAVQAESAQLAQALSDHEQGGGEFFDKSATKLAQLMETLAEEQLDTLVGETASQHDDQLLAELRLHKKQIDLAELQSKKERAALQVIKRAQHDFGEFKSLVYHYELTDHRYHFDLSLSEFHRLLEDITDLRASPQSIIERLLNKRRVSLRTDNVSRSGGDIAVSVLSAVLQAGIEAAVSSPSRSSGSSHSSSSGYSSSSSTGGGGFTTTSSTGGKGYRTTDSF